MILRPVLTAFDTPWTARPRRPTNWVLFAVCLAVLAWSAPSTSRADNVPWPQDIASYKIHATLQHKLRRIDGKMRLTWRNPSKAPVKTLRLHLYINAFRNEKSTFLRDLRKLGRFGAFGYRVPRGHWGWCKLRKLKLADGTDLSSKARFISPDDGNPHDRTMLEIKLPKPVPAGGKIQLDIDFQTRLPWGMFRVGYRKDYYFVGQWYPKVAVYEPKGVRGAPRPRWNSHQFHATSEFYADFGHYQVDITVPKRFIVGATGERRRVTTDAKAGTKTYRFVQSHVHDFAWTASPRYIRVERQFDPSRDVSISLRKKWAKKLGISTAKLALRPVKMILMMQPEHKHLIERHVKALRSALLTYGLWLGAYPYSTITLVDPVYEGAIRAFSGMEYATLFTAGTRMNIDPKNRSLEWLIIHEYGHMYFQGMLASNEFEEPWLDEGVNTYTNTKLLKWLYPDAHQSLHALHLSWGWLAAIPLHNENFPRLGYLAMGTTQDPVARRAWEFQSGVSYGQQAYFKAALVLRTLERILGEDTMLRAMRSYYQTWRFKHPSGADFQRHIQKFSKRPLAPYFDQFIKGSKVLDYAVGRISSHRIWRDDGKFGPLLPRAKPEKRAAPKKRKRSKKSPASQPAPRRTAATSRPSTRKAYTILRTQSPRAPRKRQVKRRRSAKKPPKRAAKKRNRWRSIVVIQRRGSAIWPVEFQAVFADKSVIKKRWDGKERWARFVFHTPSRLDHVEIDPKRKLTLDVDISNNSRTLRTSKRASVGWFIRLVSWLQHILLSLALLL